MSFIGSKLFDKQILWLLRLIHKFESQIHRCSGEMLSLQFGWLRHHNFVHFILNSIRIQNINKLLSEWVLQNFGLYVGIIFSCHFCWDGFLVRYAQIVRMRSKLISTHVFHTYVNSALNKKISGSGRIGSRIV